VNAKEMYMDDTKTSLDVEAIKKDFPILSTKMSGKPLVYLDSAATSQKPMQVIDAITEYYKKYNANIHRGIYEIAEEATEKYEESKSKIAKMIGAESTENIIYVRNTTEALNLIALTWAEQNISEGDVILISEMEHHSNIVPWLLLSKRKKAKLEYIKVDRDTGLLNDESAKEKLENKPKLVSITYASNVLGTINDVKKISETAHKNGAMVVVDAAQAVPHMKVDVKGIDCDFMAFSGHKMLGPTGIGVLYGKKDILSATEPIMGGGDMIRSVSRYSCTWNDLPWKFEAGTSNIEGGIGMTPAIQYLQKLGMENIFKHEVELTKYALDALAEIKNVETYGPDMKKNDHGGVISFSVNGVHPHDIASIFDNYNVAIRAGHHCAMPLVTQILRQSAVARMSFYIYNNKDDIDKAVEAINEVKRIFKK
jgi:cysteine desulfurase/selenocysteine lyase